MILFTSKNCVVNGRTLAGVPTLLDHRGAPFLPAIDYFSEAMFTERMSATTARENAYAIHSWLEFLHRESRDWTLPTRRLLKVWRDARFSRPKRSWKTGRYRDQRCSRDINSDMDSILAFYQWAETNRLTSGVAPPPRSTATGYALPSQPPYIRVPRLPYRHTPTDDEILKLHRATLQLANAERNALIFSWMEEVGLRRAEVLRSLTLDKFPRRQEMTQAFASRRTFTIEVGGKRGTVRLVPVSPHLVQRTFRYIDGERAAILARVKSGREDEWPKTVFISQRGGPLSLAYISNLSTKLFAAAGISNASQHRLRSRALTLLALAMLRRARKQGIKVDIESTAIKVAELAGHSHWQSLVPYVRFAALLEAEPDDAELFADHFVSRFRRRASERGAGPAIRLVEAASRMDVVRATSAFEAIMELLNGQPDVGVK